MFESYVYLYIHSYRLHPRQHGNILDHYPKRKWIVEIVITFNIRN